MSFFEFPHTRTYDSDLGWLIKDYKHISGLIASLNEWKEETQPTIEEFQQLYDEIMSGNLPEAMTDAIHEWLVVNAGDILPDIVKNVFFGLSDDGYFIAFIPDSWDDITFGTTGYDDFPSGVDYGHLTLSY